MTCTHCKNNDKLSTSTLIQIICQFIIDKSGTNVVVIDVRNISTFTDYFIIAEGNVSVHLRAIFREIEEQLEKKGIPISSMEGIDGDWIVLDLNDVVVHLLTHEMRMKYRLEEVWKEGDLVEVPVVYNEEKI